MGRRTGSIAAGWPVASLPGGAGGGAASGTGTGTGAGTGPLAPYGTGAGTCTGALCGPDGIASDDDGVDGATTGTPSWVPPCGIIIDSLICAGATAACAASSAATNSVAVW